MKCLCGADPLQCGEMVTSHFVVKSTLISLLLLNRQNLFPVSNNSCPIASKCTANMHCALSKSASLYKCQFCSELQLTVQLQ